MTGQRPDRRYDVVVIGEVLIEVSTATPWQAGASARLSFSGDALNAAAASAAAGARTGLLARIADDELGRALLAHVEALGIDPALILPVEGQHGTYFVHADPGGARQFVYARAGSAGSALCVEDVTAAELDRAGVVLASGVGYALSASAAAGIETAAGIAETFVYDPNFRPRLTSPDRAAAALARLAPHAFLVTPAWPQEARALLSATGPEDAARRARALGAVAAAVTMGADGVLLDDGVRPVHVPAVPAPHVVDQTGAGDVFTGTVCARLALGDGLPIAVRLGVAAAALSLQGQGGAGFLPTLEETVRHAQLAGPAPVAPTRASAEGVQ